MTAQRLIEMSNDSHVPIENVVVHKESAFNRTGFVPQNLQLSDIKKGMLTFYTNVSNHAVALATIAINNVKNLKYVVINC